MQDFDKKTILVAPLDWGLGHATRCIPIIKELLNRRCRVLIAASGAQKALLIKEFPVTSFLDIPGYHIRYASGRVQFLVKMIFQTPRILHTIKVEHDWLKQTVKQYRIDAVIADNRYGLYHENIPSVFITHQLQVQSGFGSTGAAVLRNWQYKYINRFSACWVPDLEQEAMSLAGALSHPKELPAIPVVYAGPLSRFEKYDGITSRYRLLVLLSGPEPQRSILEGKLLHQLEQFPHPVLFIRGLPDGDSTQTHRIHSQQMSRHENKNLSFIHHLPAQELNMAVLAADMVICRSGYTTVMDVLSLEKKSIMIPTPGQTEQEYLAAYLHGRELAYTCSQKNFSLNTVLEEASRFPYRFLAGADYSLYKKAVDSMIF